MNKLKINEEIAENPIKENFTQLFYNLICSFQQKEDSQFNNFISNHKFFGIQKNQENQTQTFKICIALISQQNQLSFMITVEQINKEEELRFLKNVDKFKDNLLATVAHDLRSPLNTIMYLIDQAVETGQIYPNAFSIIKSNSNFLMSLINDILDYSQFKLAKLKFAIEWFNVSLMINDVFETVNVSAQLKNIKFTTSIKIPNTFQIKSDRRRIIQVLFNLFSNALKFTATGEINLKIFQLPNQKNLLYFSMRDTGSGMTEDTISKLGNEFVTVGSRFQQNVYGVGLGLNLSKKIIQQLGPMESFEISSTLGEGSVFTFSLYTNYTVFENQKLQIFQQQSTLNQDEIENEEFIDSKFECYEFPKVHQKIGLLKKNSNSLLIKNNFNNSSLGTILIADDNAFNLFVLKSQLTKINENYQILEAYNGEEAINLFMKYNLLKQIKSENQPIQLIIMDCQMPIISGFKASKKIRKLENSLNYIKTNIIAYSSVLTEAQIAKCQKNGMDNCFLKPMNENQLKQLVCNYLKNN